MDKSDMEMTDSACETVDGSVAKVERCNHLGDGSDCIEVSNSTNNILSHCDVSQKGSSLKCLPVHLNGIVHNNIDHRNHGKKSEDAVVQDAPEVRSCVTDLHIQSDNTDGCSEAAHACSINCDSQTIQKPSDQDMNVSEKEAELLDLSALSIKDSSEDTDIIEDIHYVVYQSELQMPGIMRLITKDLSEPYSVYTYRYFIHNWPKLCFLAMHNDNCVGAIVCKLDLHKKVIRRGYIAMLAVDQEYRRRRIGSHLVLKAIRAMTEDQCDEVVLETEITNKGALRLYKNLGFVRDKRLFRYYLNGVDALRLKLWLS